MNSIDTFADQIADSGVRDIFGVPGGGPSLTLLDWLEKRGVRFHLTHTEAASAICAGIWGKLSGNAGVCITIKGPGLINAVPGLALAHFEDFPLVALTEAYAASDSPIKAHKRIDHQLLTQAFAKANVYLEDEGTTYASVRGVAESETPGVVVLNLSRGTSQLNYQFRELGQTSSSSNYSRYARPIVIAGSLAVRQGFTRILETLRFPVFSTVAAKGIIDESLPHAAGIFTGAGKDLAPESEIVGKADLVICIGLRAKEVLSVGKFKSASVNIDLVDSRLESDGFGFSETFGIRQGKELLAGLADKSWGQDVIGQVHRRMMDHLLENDRFLPPRVFHELAQIIKPKNRIVVDTGDFNTVAEHCVTARGLNDYLSTPNSRYMGTALPVGIAAAMHDPGIPHVVVVGDGGMGAHVSELKLAVANKLPLLVLLFSDGGFGSIRGRAKQLKLTLKPITVTNPSWEKIIGGIGIPSVRISSLNEFDSHLRQWNFLDGPSFMELRFNPGEYEMMAKRLR